MNFIVSTSFYFWVASMLGAPEWPFYASFGIKLSEIKVATKTISFIRPPTEADKYLRGIKIQILSFFKVKLKKREKK